MNNIELQKEVVKKAMTDETFKSDFLKNPKGTIEKAFGMKLPHGLAVRAIEEEEGTLSIVLPKNSGELSDKELDNVAGGCGIHWCPYNGIL